MDLMKGANRALMHKLASGKGTEAFAMGPNDWAKNMMKKMGWKEGKGIGKKEDGIVKHIRVEVKDNNDGVGAVAIDVVNNPHCGINHWSDTFESVKVNIRCGSSSDDGDNAGEGSDSDSDSSSSDSSDSEAQMVSTTGANATTNDIYRELYIASKGRRIGQRNHGVQRGKWQRTEGTDRRADAKAETESLQTAKTTNTSMDDSEVKQRKKEDTEKKNKNKTKKKQKKQQQQQQTKKMKEKAKKDNKQNEGVGKVGSDRNSQPRKRKASDDIDANSKPVADTKRVKGVPAGGGGGGCGNSSSSMNSVADSPKKKSKKDKKKEKKLDKTKKQKKQKKKKQQKKTKK
eukprot:INCI17584.12.p2 GENE.INCI17584.12~~INCI17584.12.p2  ORF type:complete len:344 (+),score=105.31 INCI17584.12:395-1426(+)